MRIPAPETCGQAIRSTPSAIPWAWGWQSAPASSAPRSGDISEGSSGGALLNVYGQVVAVTSGAYVYGNSMYLAVPIDPILTADLTGEGLTLPEVLEAETVG